MLNGKKVFIVGDANVDIIVPYPKFLNPERTNVKYPTPCMQGGGTAANTAVALGRLKIPVEFLGTLGDDQYGSYVMKDFRDEGVGTKHIIVDEQLHTVGVFAFIDEYGERYLWGWPRTQQAFKVLEEDKVDYTVIKNAAWVHSSGMAMVHNTSARHTILKILKTAKEAGVPTSFDLNLRVNNGELEDDYKEAVMQAMGYCNYILGSGEEEFYYLHPMEDWADSVKYFAAPDRILIARMGKKGSMAVTNVKTITQAAFPVTVSDTVGAGDVYNAGFIAARLQGKALKDCLIQGNAVSGYTVSKKGARSCPDRQQTDTFIKQYSATS